MPKKQKTNNGAKKAGLVFEPTGMAVYAKGGVRLGEVREADMCAPASARFAFYPGEELIAECGGLSFDELQELADKVSELEEG